MRYRYTIIKGNYISEEGQKYVAYGVVLFKKHTKGFVAVRVVQDVFFEHKKAKDFVGLCNQNELSPIHLDDVIEDIL